MGARSIRLSSAAAAAAGGLTLKDVAGARPHPKLVALKLGKVPLALLEIALVQEDVRLSDGLLTLDVALALFVADLGQQVGSDNAAVVLRSLAGAFPLSAIVLLRGAPQHVWGERRAPARAEARWAARPHPSIQLLRHQHRMQPLVSAFRNAGGTDKKSSFSRLAFVMPLTTEPKTLWSGSLVMPG